MVYPALLLSVDLDYSGSVPCNIDNYNAADDQCVFPPAIPLFVDLPYGGKVPCNISNCIVAFLDDY